MAPGKKPCVDVSRYKNVGATEKIILVPAAAVRGPRDAREGGGIPSLSDLWTTTSPARCPGEKSIGLSFLRNVIYETDSPVELA
ncbi:hypothetical protein EVAR_96051_1 [Eumeta japonica]|uniref:Uncharacterized protein n=1 Tax=Eumeta variegata TaxID=151549 RepID=A0A4C1W6U8_EUMVA|nr:hypothetical protein EVAR_96051_1 [Eumeta japonica]